jgi:surfactin synthase thioesterase subunit
MRKGYVDASIGQIHFIEAGRGPDLLLIPHVGRSSRMYLDLIHELSGTFHVLSFGVPGTEGSVPCHCNP